jgi:hypothetical protein
VAGKRTAQITVQSFGSWGAVPYSMLPLLSVLAAVTNLIKPEKSITLGNMCDLGLLDLDVTRRARLPHHHQCRFLARPGHVQCQRRLRGF